jgi:hypothetical protein
LDAHEAMRSVKPTSIITKHPDREPDIAAYIVTGLKQEEKPA